jgi:hypothetical protein
MDYESTPVEALQFKRRIAEPVLKFFFFPFLKILCNVTMYNEKNKKLG